jgi:WD40 repeat protein
MLRYIVVLMLIMLAACDSGGTPTPSVAENVRNVATVPAPEWQDASEVIRLDTVTRLDYLGRLDAPSEPSTVFAHALAADGTRLAGLNNELLSAWDLLTGETIFTVSRGDGNDVFYGPDKTAVYMLQSDGRLTGYDTESGRMIGDPFRVHESYNGTRSYYAEEGWLAVGGLSGEVLVWDLLTGELASKFKAHDLQIRRLIFSADGQAIVTASDTTEVKVWDWQAQSLVTEVENGADVRNIAIAPDMSQFATGGRQNTKLWSLPAGELIYTIDTGPEGVGVLAYSPDSAVLISAGNPSDLSVWNPADGRLMARLPGVGGDLLSYAFSVNGDILVTAPFGGTTSLWNMRTITAETVNRADLDLPEALIFAVSWTEDERLLLLFGASGSVHLWGISEEATP